MKIVTLHVSSSPVSMNERSVYFGENHVCRTHNALFYEDINSSIIFLTGFRRYSSSHASCTPRTLMNGQTSYFFHLSHSFFLLARGWIICQKNYIKSFFFALPKPVQYTFADVSVRELLVLPLGSEMRPPSHAYCVLDKGKSLFF